MFSMNVGFLSSSTSVHFRIKLRHCHLRYIEVFSLGRSLCFLRLFKLDELELGGPEREPAVERLGSCSSVISMNFDQLDLDPEEESIDLGDI